ncbi:MAG: phosphoglycerate kinase, partial [Candidatus Pacebacteria bacterium]|nr:phosphoglycerate kinase [Candidatus Paceibacterota bacterium]
MEYLSRLTSKEISGKICLLRVDFNLKSLEDGFRVDAVLPTIKFLLSKKARIVLLSHRGRPKGKDNSLSLKPIAKILSVKLKKKIEFIPDFNFAKIKNKIDLNKKNGVFMLENLRFLPGEEQNSAELAKKLADLGDIYVNDAFAVCHRKNASTTAITKYIKSYAGLLLEKELAGLAKATKNPKKPLVVILGGTKIADKIGVIKNLNAKTQFFIFGSSILNECGNLKMPEIYKNKKCLLPIDSVEAEGKFFDIGPQTISFYKQILSPAKTIIWNGPVGLAEDAKYSKGTREIAAAVTESKAVTVVGGGETANFILKNKLEKK